MQKSDPSFEEVKRSLEATGLEKAKIDEISRLILKKRISGKTDLINSCSDQQIILLGLIECIINLATYEKEITIFIDYLTINEDKLQPLDLGKLFHLKSIKTWKIDNNLLLTIFYLNNSIDIMTNLKESSSKMYLPRVFDTYGQVLVSQGLLFDAKLEYNKALKIKKANKDIVGQAITLGNLGRLSMQLGDFESGVNFLLEDYEIIKRVEPDNEFILSQLLSNISHCFIELGKLKQAAHFNEKSYKINNSNNFHAGVAFNIVNDAEIALRVMDNKSVNDCINKLKHILVHKPIARFLKENLLGWRYKIEALLNLLENNYVYANECFEKAINIFTKESSISNVETANLFFNYAQLNKNTNRLDSVGELYRKSLRLLDTSEENNLRRTIEEEMKLGYSDSWLLHSAGRYLGHDQIDFLLREAGSESFKGEQKDVVVLFSDIRGFTSISEVLNPIDLLRLLNGFLSRMTRAIEFYGGFVDKYIGDAIMAVFSLPNPRPTGNANDSDNAVRAALMMKEELRRFNFNLPENLPKLKIGIGLHSGKVTAGLIGSPQKRSFTVIGDVVNTTARLEGMTKMLGAEILISSKIQERLTIKDVLLRPFGKYCPKGRSKYLEVTEVIGFDDNSPRLYEIKNEVKISESAFDHFYKGRFKKASSIMLGLIDQTVNPQHQTGYKFLYQEFKKHLNDPPGKAWKGEIVLGEK